MFRSLLLWRLYAGYVVIILICTLIVGLFVGRSVVNSGIDDMHQTLAVRAELLSGVASDRLLSAINTAPVLDDSFQQTIQTLGSKTQTRLTVIAFDGKVLADSFENPNNMDNHGNRPEVKAAKVVGFATNERYSRTVEQIMLYHALAVKRDNDSIGVVRVALPLSIVDEKISELHFIVFFSACVAALVGLISSFFLARHFAAPLRTMTKAAEAISQGDYKERLSVSRNDEVGKLAKAFNLMARKSEQRMSEITEDRNRLATIFAGMVEGVIHINQDSQVVHMNQAAAKLLDVSFSNSIGKPYWESVRVREINEAVVQAVESKTVVKVQTRRAMAATDKVIDIYVAALNTDTGESAGAIIVLHDISELDSLERIRRDFVANASHELKTPITAIRGMTETILDDRDMDEGVRRSFIEKIQIQTIRLSTLVQDLMTISRLESDHSEKGFEPVDFNELVKRSANSVINVYQEKQQSFNLDIPEQKIMVLGDVQAISQMIDNLMDNAMKYTPVGGSVSASLSVIGKCAEFTIKDTGIGISVQSQARIFERFYRVDKARSRELGGTGLGLSIVKNIAGQHGGSVSVKSSPGSGSTFTLLLPLV